TISITLIDDTTDPVIVLDSLRDDTFCDMTADTGDGAIQVSIDGQSAIDASEYYFRWWQGADTLGTEITDGGFATAGTIDIDAADSSLIVGLNAGTYTVAAFDANDPNNGCATVATYTLIENNPTIEIRLADVLTYTNTNCDAANPNGGVRISQIYVDGVATAVTSDYDFVWTGLPGASVIVNQITNGDSINTLAAGTYTVRVDNTLDNMCQSGTVNVTITDDLTYPLVTSTNIVDNTSCDPDPNVGTGQLTIDIDGGASIDDYTVTWYRTAATGGNELFIPANEGSADSSTVASVRTLALTGLSTGSYFVVVENDATGCTTTASYYIEDNQTTPAFNIPTSNVTHNSNCDAAPAYNGAITISAADINTPTGAALTDFTWEYENAAGTITAFTPTTDPWTISNTLAPDTFLIRATYTATGCETEDVQVIILDQSFEPVIALDTLIHNIDCGGGNAEGEVRISVAEEDGTVDTYEFEWRNSVGTLLSSIAGITITNTATTSVVTGLGSSTASDIRVTVYNPDAALSGPTGCSISRSFEVEDREQNPVIENFVASNNTFCTGNNGQFELISASVNGVAIDSADLVDHYTLNVYEDAALTTIVTDGNAANGELLVDGLAGTTAGEDYFAVLVLDSTLCDTDPVQFQVFSNPALPEVAIEIVQADSACTNTMSTGILVATADGQTNDNADYSFRWLDSGSNVLVSNDTLSGVAAGTYTVEVTNVNSGCMRSESVTIENVPQSPEILTAATTDPTSCTPGNGLIQVTSVSIATVARYTFAFYSDVPSSGATAIQDSNSATYSQGQPDVTYYIIGTDTLTGCTTRTFQVEMGAEDVVYPEVQVAAAQDNRQCNPGLADGQLSISIFTTVNDERTMADITDYSIVWTNSAGDTITNVIDSVAMTSAIDSIGAGSYAVIATNNTTGCSTIDTVRLEDNTPPFMLLPTSAPNLNCDNPNGSVNVRVQSVDGFTRPAEFFWFIGDVENPDINNPDFTGVDEQGLEAGTYTVIARGTTDTDCISERATVEVEDGTMTPAYAIMIDNQLTVCYEDQPNGLARIDTTSNDISSYDFTWYEGPDTTGALFQTGLIADSLTVGTYTVAARDRTTGCIGIQNIEIIDDTPIIADPSIVIVEGRTNCLFPNGTAVANTGGLSDGFRFEWYAADDPETLLFTGNEVQTLDATTYEVLAIDIASGCVSGRSTVTIPYAVEDPVFTIETTASLCLRTEDGSTNQFSGQAFVAIETLGVTVDSVTYLNSDGEVILSARGAETFIDASPGVYTINFRASNGCDYTSEFEIESSIKVYNGVSANDDGLNDFFLVDCIDFFPNNNVKIFTREGILIYETDNYDNIDRRFVGISNIGATNDLPAGTYFYIIDKNDGSDLIQGYLELVR
ncbi:MAG: gliding motility-associated C-terminal domain-containing protein, partial [Bacteroidota bacterium]